MKKQVIKTVWVTVMGILCPILSNAQDFTGEIRSLQSVLDELYVEMLPLCSRLIGVGRGIAGFAALWYIAYRVWRNIANAEPIDFYPLLRPFAIGLAILLFPSVIEVMNGVLKPTVTGTAAMMKNSNNAIAYLLKKKEEAIKKTVTWQLYGDEGMHGKWYRYMHPDDPDGEEDTTGELIGNAWKFIMAKAAYNMKNHIKQWLADTLQIFYEAAALCINTIRTFYLIVLAILGPLVFGLAVFDGLQNTLTVWVSRYINVFLWLPIANIFGSIIAKIQENMLRIDIQQIELYGDTAFSSSDTGHIVFLIIGIIGYFTVPSVANYIVHAGGGNSLLSKATGFFVGGSMAIASNAVRTFIPTPTSAAQASTSASQAPATTGSAAATSGSGNYQHDKLAGNK